LLSELLEFSDALDPRRGGVSIEIGRSFIPDVEGLGALRPDIDETRDNEGEGLGSKFSFFSSKR
jgi:hypothetical protein